MRVKMRINLNTTGKIAVRGAVVTPPKTWQVVAAMPLRLPSYLLRGRKDVGTMFARRACKGSALDGMVRQVTAVPVFWVDTMMAEELGLAIAPAVPPSRSGLVVAAAYALGAAFPVIPYALPLEVTTAFRLSVACTLVALFVAGALKTLMTGRPWLRSGLETVLVGALAAAATFFAGRLIAAGA